MSTDDNLKKAKEEPAVVADDKLDAAADRIADDTSDERDGDQTPAPGGPSDNGQG